MAMCCGTRSGRRSPSNHARNWFDPPAVVPDPLAVVPDPLAVVPDPPAVVLDKQAPSTNCSQGYALG